MSTLQVEKKRNRKQKLILASSTSTLQVGLPEETKKLFWEDLDEVTQEVHRSENCSSEETLTAMSARKQRVMMGSTGA